MNSSAGTAKKTISPARWPAIPASVNPIAAPSIPAIWALWPQLWAAPVTGSASGCSEVRRLSSSPIKASRGPGAPPASRPLTPVSARPVCGAKPRAFIRSATRAAVFTSLKPVSGWRRIVSPRSMMVSAWRSMVSQTARFNWSLLLIRMPRFVCLSSCRLDLPVSRYDPKRPERPLSQLPAGLIRVTV